MRMHRVHPEEGPRHTRHSRDVGTASWSKVPLAPLPLPPPAPRSATGHLVSAPLLALLALLAPLAVLAALVAARGSKVKSSPQPYSPPTGPVDREQHPRWEGAYWVRTAHAWYRLLEPDAAYVSLWNATDGARLRVRLAG